MLRLREFGWMSRDLVQNIPHVTKEEWALILANCTEEEHITMINVYQRPGSLMPNHGNGRATPLGLTKKYWATCSMNKLD